MTKPDVESITGLSPAISIDQKTTSTNPRSTVGTITEINDYLRLLYAHVGQTHCPKCHRPVKAQTIHEIVDNIQTIIDVKISGRQDKQTDRKPTNIKIQILAPIVQGKKGTYEKLFQQYLAKGFARIRIDGQDKRLDDWENFKLEKYKKHTISLIIDRFKLTLADTFDSAKQPWKSPGDNENASTQNATQGRARNQETDKTDTAENPNTTNTDNDATDNTSISVRTKRFIDAVELATSLTDGEVMIDIDGTTHFFSEHNTCTYCNLSFPKLEPASFSFNSPKGACQTCHGLGYLKEVDIATTYNPRLTISEGGIFFWNNRTTKDTWTRRVLEAVGREHGFDLKTPIGQYSQTHFDLIFHGKGAKPKYRIEYINRQGLKRSYDAHFEGLIPEMTRRYYETTSEFQKKDLEKYFRSSECSKCHGKRLNPYSLAVTLENDTGDTANITQLGDRPLHQVIQFLQNLRLDKTKSAIAHPIIKEILSRLSFIQAVGLDYLTLNRRANTLSGGEAQRVRLASQIGTGLTGVLYVLDEPSIGLHARDVDKLLSTLRELRDNGNTVIVVEHDLETMQNADHIIDIGPYAGVHGGKLVAQGSFDEVSMLNTLTAKYLRKELRVGDSLTVVAPATIATGRQLKIDENLTSSPNTKPSNQITKQLDSINTGTTQKLTLHGVSTHNLKDIDVSIPLGKFVCVTGVSGSGKSSLINDTLYPILMNEKMRSRKPTGEYTSIDGLENIDKVIGIDQSPIGRTPRSNPVTYIGAFTYIRELFAGTQEAKARGYKPGRFSFNVKGGRCEHCRGDGQIKVEMQFLPDVYVQCEQCKGRRYNDTVLDIDFKGANIADVLEMTVEEAAQFFQAHPPIARRLELLQSVGLGYIKLGQPATTLSGGESQRVKLAKELSKTMRGHTVYILDEPTTGLHFYDVDKLLLVLKRLVARNNTVIVIEHNLDIIRHADWIIDLGPEGGEAGGQIVAEGTVQDVMATKGSYTGEWLGRG